MKIINFQNLDIQNPFNPNFSYYIVEDKIQLDNVALTKFLLNKEKEIKNIYPGGYDGDTNLGNKSITSRFSYYNLLDFKEMFFLKNIIRQNHDNFLKNLNITIDKNYYIQCWFNVLRKGEKIDRHRHASNNECYIGGHICVNVNNTCTYYESPYFGTTFCSMNEPCKITLFPNWIYHYTDKVQEDFERITIAFDILTEKSYTNFVQEKFKNHWIKI